MTIERSGYYGNFEPNYFIVVAGIITANEQQSPRLTRARAIVASAFIHPTKLYMGYRS